MSFRLVPLTPGEAPAIPLQRPILLLGRHGDCDIRLSQSRISRIHCCLALAYDRVLIRDLGSRNGLRVNGRSIQESRLYPGDEVAIGPILYRLELEGAAPLRAGESSRRSPELADNPGRPANRGETQNDQDAEGPDIGLVPLDAD
jgi:pSer/pThr/pTyr-binding forkhead associated (FHA) protein